MNLQEQINDLRERMDVAHGGFIALYSAVHALIATHPDKESLKMTFSTFCERSETHTLYATYGDELRATFERVKGELLKQIETPPGSLLR